MIAGSLSRFRGLLVLAVLVGLAVIVATAALRLQSSVVPLNLASVTPASATPVPTISPRINITRSEYEQALARWKAQKIEEYEITVDVMAFIVGGARTLRVSDYGNKVEQLAPVVRLASDLTADDVEYLKRYTVEGIFAQIEAGLAEVDALKTGTISGTGNSNWAYHATFDPNLGYPQVLSYWNRDLTDADHFMEVTDLKIIKQDN